MTGIEYNFSIVFSSSFSQNTNAKPQILPTLQRRDNKKHSFFQITSLAPPECLHREMLGVAGCGRGRKGTKNKRLLQMMFIRLAQGLMKIMGVLTLPHFYICATVDHKYCCNDGEILISSYSTPPCCQTQVGFFFFLNSHPVNFKIHLLA